MKITRTRTVKSTPVQEIHMGIVFDGEIGERYGPFLRNYQGIISLSNPGHTWLITDTLMVSNYQPLDVELVIHGPAGAGTGAVSD